jgi:hypothetical protein
LEIIIYSTNIHYIYLELSNIICDNIFEKTNIILIIELTLINLEVLRQKKNLEVCEITCENMFENYFSIILKQMD